MRVFVAPQALERDLGSKGNTERLAATGKPIWRASNGGPQKTGKNITGVAREVGLEGCFSDNCFQVNGHLGAVTEMSVTISYFVTSLEHTLSRRISSSSSVSKRPPSAR
jgi:hypothetical protein